MQTFLSSEYMIYMILNVIEFAFLRLKNFHVVKSNIPTGKFSIFYRNSWQPKYKIDTLISRYSLLAILKTFLVSCDIIYHYLFLSHYNFLPNQSTFQTFFKFFFNKHTIFHYNKLKLQQNVINIKRYTRLKFK